MLKTSVIPESTNPYLNHTFFRSRKQAWLALLGGSICVGSAVFLGNAVAARWIKFVGEDTRDGEAIVPSRKLRPLKDIAMADLNLPETSKVKLFCTNNDICEVYGSTKTYGGAFVGIPSYLNFGEEGKISFSEKLSSSVEEDEVKEITEHYLETLVFSKNAKLYIIAEGLALAKEIDHFLIPSISSSLCFLASFLQGQTVVKYTSFRGMPPSIKLMAYSVSALMWLMAFLAISDRTNLYLFENALKCLNSTHIDGGIEFYEKALIRNEIKVTTFADVSLDSRYIGSVLSDRLEKLKRRKDELLLS